MNNIKYHKVANIFPMMQDVEYKQLCADIKANGLLESIVMYENQILDGRNRYEACIECGVEPQYRQWNGSGGVIDFVISMNLNRRHLDPGQKAMCALKAEQLLGVQAKERMLLGKTIDPVANLQQGHKSRAGEQAAKMFNVSERYVNYAKKLEANAPDLAQKVRAGKITLSKANKEKRKRDNITKQEQARKTLSNEQLWTLTSDQQVIECDVLITDPPYGILDEQWDANNNTVEGVTRSWAKRWNECNADFILVFFSQRYLFDGRKWLDESLPAYDFHQLLIWHYPNNKKPHDRTGFKQTYEPIFFYRQKHSDKQIIIDGAEWGSGLNDFDCHVAAVPQTNFNNENMKQHPAQKPIEVMRWLVNATTTTGDLIVDPFCGSGTTGIAATQLKRRFYGIETNKEYLNMAEGRLALYGHRE
jgi:DNA modification methylase